MDTTGNSEWAEAIGQVPSNIEAQDAQWIKNSQPLQAIVDLQNNPDTQCFRLPTYLPEYGALLKTEMEPDFQGVLQGPMTVEAFTTKYADRFEAALVDYKAYVKK